MKVKNVLPMNLQLFGEDELNQETDNELDEAEIKAPAQHKTPSPQGKTFSEDYVKALRTEAKENRIAKSNAELKLKELIGLNTDEDLTDEKINLYKTKQEAEKGLALRKANERLILAEIKALDGYDAKLLARLLDTSKLTIEDDGSVKGLTEAVAELETDFPQIKLAGGSQGGTNPAFKAPLIGLEALRAEHQAAMKAGNLAEAIALKNKIFEMEQKQ